ncbi:MAG: DMT family transporter [Bacteroidia bacterium]|nr:DMT family transporter [Bacteroidia bacterium]
MKVSKQAHLAIFLANLIYGANFSIARFAMPEYLSPSGFIMLRVAFATVLFILLDRISPSIRPLEKKDVFRFILLGLFGVAINQLLFFEGLNRTTNINAALIMTSTPVLVTAMAFLLLKDRLTTLQSIGILLGLSGAITLILQYENVSGSASGIGDLMVFLNAASYALFMVLAKPMMKKYGTIQVIKWAFVFGTIFVIPFGAPDLIGVQWSEFPASAWFAVIFVLVFTTFGAYLLNTFGLKYLSPSVVSYYIYLQPLFATLISGFMTHEMVTPVQVMACILIFTGVYLVNRRILVKTES